jgi:hypothetical protein
MVRTEYGMFLKYQRMNIFILEGLGWISHFSYQYTITFLQYYIGSLEIIIRYKMNLTDIVSAVIKMNIFILFEEMIVCVIIICILKTNKF